MFKEYSTESQVENPFRKVPLAEHLLHRLFLFSIYKKEKNPKRDHCGRPNTPTSSLFEQK
jgi:hypothetical protein